MSRLFALVPAAWNDALRIIARRWWVGVGAAVVVGILATQRTEAGTASLVAAIAALIVTGIMWLFVFAETMRTDDPAFQLDWGSFWRIIGIGLLIALAMSACYLPGIMLSFGLRQTWIGSVWLIVVVAAIGAKTGFAYFRMDDENGAFGSSWRLTGGRAFLPSVVLFVICFLCLGATALIAMPLLPQPADDIIAQALQTVAAFLLYAFFMSWTLRWMRVAETFSTGPVLSAETTP